MIEENSAEDIYDHMHKRSTIEREQYSDGVTVLSLCEQKFIKKTDIEKGTPCPVCDELYEKFLNTQY